MKIDTFCNRYRNGEFSSPEFETQVDAGWLDWFCPAEELPERLAPMAGLLCRIQSPFILGCFTARFCNHCPIGFPLYDEIQFQYQDREREDQYGFTVIFGAPGESPISVCTRRNDGNGEAGFRDMDGVLAWIENWEKEARNPAFWERKREQDAEIEAAVQKGLDLLSDVEQMMEEGE